RMSSGCFGALHRNTIVCGFADRSKYNLKMNNAVRQTYSGRFCLDTFAGKPRRYLITDLNGPRTWSDFAAGHPAYSRPSGKGTENACVLVAGCSEPSASPWYLPPQNGGPRPDRSTPAYFTPKNF